MKKAIVPLGIVLLIAFGVFMYYNRFITFHISDVDGYVFNTNDIVTNLSAGINEDSNKITFETVKINDTIYKSGKKYYIGEETKKNVIIDFPIVAEDKSSLLVLSDTGKYVEETFEKSSTYKNSIITEGSLYNGVNNTKVDESNYIFLELGNGIYVNLVDLELKRDEKEYKIPKYSFIYFERTFLRYYYYQNGVYKYEEIANIRDYSDIKVREYTYDYYDFLIYLGVLERPDLKDEEILEIPEPETPGVGAGNVSAGTEADSIQLPPPQIEFNGVDFVDKEYVKPEVTFSNPKAGVYSWSGDLVVKDPADRIYKAPLFEFRVDGKVYMRSTYTRTMKIETIGLLPNVEYEVYAYYRYLDHNDTKKEVKIYEGTFKTKGIDDLEVLKMEIGKITPNIKDVKFDEIILKNNPEDEVLKGLKNGSIFIGDRLEFDLNASNINKLVNLKATEYEVGEVLRSGTKYNGSIVLYDVAGNELKITGNLFEFETLKTPPVGKIEVNSFDKNFTGASMTITLSNPDEMLDDGNSYRYVIFDESGAIIEEEKMSEPSKISTSHSYKIKRLKPMQKYTVKIFCNYYDENKGWVYNYEMDSEEIFTEDFSVLGAIPITIDIPEAELSHDSAKVIISFDQYDPDGVLYKEMADLIPITITNIDNPDEIIQFKDIRMTETILSLAGKIELDLTGMLSSNSEYVIKVEPYIDLGDSKYYIPTDPKEKHFITYKKPVEVYYANGYTADGYIDFDVCIEDRDGALDIKKDDIYNPESVTFSFHMLSTETQGASTQVGNTYQVSPKQSCTSAIPPSSEGTNDSTDVGNPDENNQNLITDYSGYTRITVTELEGDRNYAIKYKIGEYNYSREGTTTFGAITDLISNLKASGSSATLKLVELTNQVNYNIEQTKKNETSGTVNMTDVNVFDIKNNSRWIYQGEDETTGDTKKLKLNDNIIEFSSISGYKTFSYYMPELKGETYRISFKYKLSSNTNAYINTVDDFTEAVGKKISSTTGSDYKEISLLVCPSGVGSVTDSSGATKTCDLYQTGKYLTFYLKPTGTSGAKSVWEINEFKLSLGPDETTYSEFGSTGNEDAVSDSYAGKFDVTISNIIDLENIRNQISLGEIPEGFLNIDWNYKYYIEYIADGVSVKDCLIEFNPKDGESECIDSVNASGENSDEEENGESEPSEGESLEDIITKYATTNRLIKEQIAANKSFEAIIGVEVGYNDHYTKKHPLTNVSFSTEAETRTITNPNEFKNMHPYGYYLVDLENENFTITCTQDDMNTFQTDEEYLKKPCINLTSYKYDKVFQGNIDFQGYKVQLDVINGAFNPIFATLGSGAVVKNMDLEIRFKENNIWDSNISGFTAVSTTNNGLISNINIKLKVPGGFYQPRIFIEAAKSNEENAPTIPMYFRDTGHTNFSLISTTNNGIIENFAIELTEKIPILSNSGLVSVTNNGTIQNGYIIGQNIVSGYINRTKNTDSSYTTATKNIGIFASKTTANSTIKNVYTTIDVLTSEVSLSTEKIVCPKDVNATCDDEVELQNESILGVTELGTFTLLASDKIAGNIVSSATNAFVKNAVLFDPRVMPKDNPDYNYPAEYESTGRETNYDLAILSNSSSDIEKIYTIHKEKFLENNTESISPDILYHDTFLTQTLNKDKKFDSVQAYFDGRLPHVIWPNNMPKQTVVKKPAANTEPKIEIVGVKSVKQDRNLIAEDYLSDKNNYDMAFASGGNIKSIDDVFAVINISLINKNNKYKFVDLNIAGISKYDDKNKNTNLLIIADPDVNDKGVMDLKIAIGRPSLYKEKYVLDDLVVKVKSDFTYQYESSLSCKTSGIDTFTTGFDCDKTHYLELDLYKEITSYDDVDENGKYKEDSFVGALNAGHTNLIMMNNIKIGEVTTKIGEDGKEHKEVSYKTLKDKSNNYFSGVLDGNGYTIYTEGTQEKPGALYTKNCLIKELRGKIKNININSNIIDSNNNSSKSGLICDITTGAEVDNVHIGSTEIAAHVKSTNVSLYLGGLVAYSTGGIISNSSVSNITINQNSLDVLKSQFGKVYFGGLIGRAVTINISNSFVRNIDISLISATSSVYGYESLAAAGGIVGVLDAGNIENVYATGTINSELGGADFGIGGIAGHTTGYIKSAISKVNIYANSDNLGGIVGSTTLNSGYISKTLVLGDILTLLEEGKYSNLERTSGTSITPSQNFAWSYQSLNSVVTPDTSMEQLLDSDELKIPSVYSTKIGLSEDDFYIGLNDKNQYDHKIFVISNDENNYLVSFSELLEETDENGNTIRYFMNGEEKIIINKEFSTLPRLLHSETKELLANQEFEKNSKGQLKSDGDYVVNYVATFEILSIDKQSYMYKASNGVHTSTENDYEAEYVNLGFYMNIAYTTDESKQISEQLKFYITDMVPYCDKDSELYEECKKRDYIIPSVIDNVRQFTPESGCTDANECYYVELKVQAAPNKNYVNYTISNIKYKYKNNQNDERDFRTKIKMKIPFYGRIETIEDWQNVEYGTYQNYAVTGVIDFAGVDKPNLNLSFENLIGVSTGGRTPKIINLTIENQPAGTSLIKNINSEIKGVDFQNITITSTGSGNNLSIIQNLKGNLYGHNPTSEQNSDKYMSFEDITITAPGINYVGIISKNNSAQINYVNLKNINVSGKNYVGGFIAETPALKYKYNINGEFIKVSAAQQFAGGIQGLEPSTYSNNRFNKNIKIRGINVYAKKGYAGGVFGRGSGDNIIIEGVEEGGYNIVEGDASYTGGISGHCSSHHYLVNNVAKYLTVDGTSYVGGLFGLDAYNSYSKSIRNKVIASGNYVGGISGSNGSELRHGTVAGGTIDASNSDLVGGIIGYTSRTVADSQVGTYVDGNLEYYTTIRGRTQVGGIVGKLNQSGYVVRSIVHARIKGNHIVGGAIGEVYNYKSGTKTQPAAYINNVVVANSQIVAVSKAGSGNYYAGGLIGRTYRTFNTTNDYDNLVIADIIATDSKNTKLSPTSIHGVGYIVGAAVHTDSIKSTILVDSFDEEGNPTQIKQTITTSYDYNTRYGDKFVDGTISEFYSAIKNTRLYSGSTINGVAYSEVKKDTYKDTEFGQTYVNMTKGHLKSISDINLKSTYGTNYVMSTKDKNENNITYFPYLNKGANYKLETLTNDEFDTTTWSRKTSEQIFNKISHNWDDFVKNPVGNISSVGEEYYSSYKPLPEFDVYAVDVDKINIEFKSLDLESSFILNKNRYQINKNVFTFYYDFKDDFVVEITDGTNKKVITIKAEEVKNGVTVIGDYYYYLDDGEIVTNDPNNAVITPPNEDEKEVTEEDEKEVTEEDDKEGSSSETSNVNNENSVETEQVAYNSQNITLLSTSKSQNVQIKLKETEKKTVIDNATNIYEGKVLLDDQKIYDIESGKVTHNTFENLTLAETSSLYDFSYGGNSIKTYKNYSVINGQILNKQIFVKGEQIEVIEQQGVNNLTNKVIIDNYNDQSILLYLGTDGKIYCLKEKIVYPKNFKNLNIKNISTNVTKDSNILFVEYKDGSYIAFNYLTGQILTQSNNQKMGLIDYVKQELQLSEEKYKIEPSNNSYKEAKKLVSDLNKKSIDQVLLGENDSDAPELYSRKYSVSYNPANGKYFVYEIPTKSGVSNDNKSLIESLTKSVDSMIEDNPILLKYYKGESYTKINQLPSLIITIGIIIGIIISTVSLGKYLKKRRKITT